MVRTRDQIKRPLQKGPTRHSTREKKMGRQKKRWEDNIKEWTGLDFNTSQRAAVDRQRWQKIVADVWSGAPTTLMVPGHRRTDETVCVHIDMDIRVIIECLK